MFGIYNNYAEEWLAGDDGKPQLFTTREEATAFAEADALTFDLDAGESEVKEYK